MTGRRMVLAAVVLTAAALVPRAAAANAGPATDPYQRAAQLTAELNRLQTLAEVATERYDGLEEQLGRVVDERMLAEEAVASAQSARADAVQTQSDRVAALYMSGGQLGLLAEVLAGGSPGDVAARLMDAQAVVTADAAATRTATGAVRAASRTAERLAALAARATALQVAAAAAADHVRALIGQTETLLADADAQIRALIARQQAAAQLAGAHAFQAAVAAGPDAGLPGDGFADPGLAGSATAPNPIAAAAIAAARTRLGDPYVWGGSGPAVFDCSGLVQWSYARAGLSLPRTAEEQWFTGPHPALSSLAPGDLLFWATDIADPLTIYHVAMYLGNGLMIVAPHTGTDVQIMPVYLNGLIGATRPTDGVTTG
jgi:cell wall-associated NlpC family hydrolase